MNQYVLYKPRKTNDGCAANFSVNGENCFLQVAKQKPSSGENDAFDWKDENNKPRCNIKLGLPDIGSFLALFNGKTKSFKLYHEFTKDEKKISTSISCSIYEDRETKEAKGYSVNVIRGEFKAGFGIHFSEAECLKVLLQEAILNQTHVEFKAKN